MTPRLQKSSGNLSKQGSLLSGLSAGNLRVIAEHLQASLPFSVHTPSFPTSSLMLSTFLWQSRRPSCRFPSAVRIQLMHVALLRVVQKPLEAAAWESSTTLINLPDSQNIPKARDPGHAQTPPKALQSLARVTCTVTGHSWRTKSSLTSRLKIRRGGAGGFSGTGSGVHTAGEAQVMLEQTGISREV